MVIVDIPHYHYPRKYLNHPFLPIDFLKNRKGYTATLYYQASEEKKDVVDTKKIRLENRNEVIIDLVGNSGCVLHFSILNFQ